jgi:hypothetical protein
MAVQPLIIICEVHNPTIFCQKPHEKPEKPTFTENTFNHGWTLMHTDCFKQPRNEETKGTNCRARITMICLGWDERKAYRGVL